ncbi:MAG: hypothetical protein ABIT37_18050 [Luteolibacter sp.]
MKNFDEVEVIVKDGDQTRARDVLVPLIFIALLPLRVVVVSDAIADWVALDP